jgi:hypothetical protein
MLKFSVHTFYQPLFSIFPSAIFPFPFGIFPSTILFPSKGFPHQKTQSKAPKSKKQKVPLHPSVVFIAANRVEPTGGV